MDQFLLGYWWLVVIAVIIIILITRSLIKFLVTFVAVIVIFVVVWDVFISSGFSKTTWCFSEAAKSATSAYRKAQMVSPGNEWGQIICIEDEVSYNNLISCLEASKKESGFSFKLYSTLPIFKKTLDEMVTGHNKLCPDSQLSQPSF